MQKYTDKYTNIPFKKKIMLHEVVKASEAEIYSGFYEIDPYEKGFPDDSYE